MVTVELQESTGIDATAKTQNATGTPSGALRSATLEFCSDAPFIQNERGNILVPGERTAGRHLFRAGDKRWTNQYQEIDKEVKILPEVKKKQEKTVLVFSCCIILERVIVSQSYPFVPAAMFCLVDHILP